MNENTKALEWQPRLDRLKTALVKEREGNTVLDLDAWLDEVKTQVNDYTAENTKALHQARMQVVERDTELAELRAQLAEAKEQLEERDAQLAAWKAKMDALPLGHTDVQLGYSTYNHMNAAYQHFATRAKPKESE